MTLLKYLIRIWKWKYKYKGLKCLYVECKKYSAKRKVNKISRYI